MANRGSLYQPTVAQSPTVVQRFGTFFDARAELEKRLAGSLLEMKGAYVTLKGLQRQMQQADVNDVPRIRQEVQSATTAYALAVEAYRYSYQALYDIEPTQEEIEVAIGVEAPDRGTLLEDNTAIIMDDDEEGPCWTFTYGIEVALRRFGWLGKQYDGRRARQAFDEELNRKVPLPALARLIKMTYYASGNTPVGRQAKIALQSYLNQQKQSWFGRKTAQGIVNAWLLLTARSKNPEIHSLHDKIQQLSQQLFLAKSLLSVKKTSFKFIDH